MNQNLAIQPMKFDQYKMTAKGEERASVDLVQLKTLWFNSGTQCNLSCKNCYIESSPTNDRLVFLTLSDVVPYLEEIKDNQMPTELIGITGGEPFLNPEMIPILRAILAEGIEVLVLTNAYRMMGRHKAELVELREKYGDRLHIRVSLDHYTKEAHEGERGLNTFDKALEGIQWLHKNQFNLSIAGRSLRAETTDEARSGYDQLLSRLDVNLDVINKIVIFPEMEMSSEVPEITTKCWDILKVSPDDQMCASERMIVKRKGEARAKVLPCTLLAYDTQFELGHSLKDSEKKVYLNHKFCAQFCVLGGASCSSTK